MEWAGGVGVDLLWAEYVSELRSQAPGSNRRLIALLGRIIERTRLDGGTLDPRTPALFALASEITKEICARAKRWKFRRSSDPGPCSDGGIDSPSLDGGNFHLARGDEDPLRRQD